jgi:glycine/D-amino acid oxidase-like deaminating enzyme
LDREYLEGTLGELGELGSPWLSAEAPTHPPLAGDVEADAIVVGAGLTGALVAAELAARGHSVVVLERNRAASGTTGHSTAKITVLHGTQWSTIVRRRGVSEALAQWAGLNAVAPSWIRRIVEDRGIACRYRPVEGYLCELPGRTDDALVREWQALRTLGLAEGAADVIDGSPFGPVVALPVPGQALFDPAAFTLGLLATLPAESVRLFEDTAVRQLHHARGMWHAQTDGGSARAPVAVLASLAPAADPAVLFARYFPYTHYALEGMLSAEAADGLWIQANGSELTARPTDDPGGPWILSGASSRSGMHADDRDAYRMLREQSGAEAGLVSAARAWSAEDLETPDGLPFVGRVGPFGGLYYIGGFAGWGMTKSVASAALVADQIEGVAPRELSKLLSPDRFPTRSTWPTLVRENLHTARHYVVPTAFQRHAASALPPSLALGDAMPRCTHLGCRTKINTAEGTIDCPCHGSRFRASGRPLCGPARQNLRLRG